MSDNMSHLPADIIDLIEQVRIESQTKDMSYIFGTDEITPAQARRTNKALGLDSGDMAAVLNHLNRDR